MRVCPRCQARYDEETRFCPRDGAALPAPESDARLGQVLLGQFELLEVCGRGAMGTVYRAWQAGMDREVAVKMLRTDVVRDPGVVKRFHREARSVARLHHPNIVTVFMVGETDDHVPYLVMEYVDGQPLSVELGRGEPMPPARALRIGRLIASALAEAHAAGIVHRDLKPANILLEQRRRAADFVKVVDFGIAKIVGGESGGPEPGISALTRTGTIFGTPHYISPEQAQGVPVDGRADLYALGVMLFQMLTGRLPFDGTGMAVVIAHVNQAPPRPSSIVAGMDPAIEAFVMRLLEKDPAARVQSAEDASDAIDGLLQAMGASAWPRADSQPFTPGPTLPSGAVVAQGMGRMESSPVAVTMKGEALKPPPGTPLALLAGQNGSGGAVSPLAVTVTPHGPAPGGPGSRVQPMQGMPSSAAGSMLVDATIPPPSKQVAVPQVIMSERSAAETNFIQGWAPPAGGVPAMAGNGASASVVSPSMAPMTLDDGSSVWQPPASPWRKLLLVFFLLLLACGVAAAGVYVWQERQAALDSENAGAVAPGGEVPAVVLDAGVAAVTPADGAPVDDGTQGGGGAVSGGGGPPVIKADAGGVPSNYRVVTLGEKGYAVRVLVPPTVIAGDDVMVAIEVWDPKGKPIAANELRVVIEEPSGVERAITMPATDVDGRYASKRRFPKGGHYHFHIYPGGARADVVVWFDLQVLNADGTTPKVNPSKRHDDGPNHGKPKKGGGGTKKDTGEADPYHMIDDAAGAAGGAGAGNESGGGGAFGAGGDKKEEEKKEEPPPPPPPPPKKDKPDDGEDGLLE